MTKLRMKHERRKRKEQSFLFLLIALVLFGSLMIWGAPDHKSSISGENLHIAADRNGAPPVKGDPDYKEGWR